MADRKTKKLHELIAVKASHRTQATATLRDLGNTFEKKRHHFEAKRKVYSPDGEGLVPVTEEVTELQTTVAKELAWVMEFLVKAMDASLQTCLGDTQAFADIVLEDGTAIAEHVPNITLLELEDRLEELRAFCGKIPTLDPAKGFVVDPDKGPGIFVAREVVKRRTQMRQKALVLYPATPEHPAQTQLITEQSEVGTIRELEWSSMLTPAAKGEIIERVEKLSRAVKAARSRANTVDVDTTKVIGDKLIRYAFGL